MNYVGDWSCRVKDMLNQRSSSILYAAKDCYRK